MSSRPKERFVPTNGPAKPGLGGHPPRAPSGYDARYGGAPGRPGGSVGQRRSGGGSPQGQPHVGSRAAFAQTAGAQRLNRILHQHPTKRTSYVPDENRHASYGQGAYGAGSARRRSLLRANAGGPGGASAAAEAGPTISDPTNEAAVGRWMAALSSGLKVDPRSIGGHLLQAATGEESTATAGAGAGAGPSSNLLMQGGRQGKPPAGTRAKAKVSGRAKLLDTLKNECLFSARVHKFEITGGQQDQASKRNAPRSRNKLRYVGVIRTTNRFLVIPKASEDDGAPGGMSMDEGDDVSVTPSQGEDSGYDQMFNRDDESTATGRTGGGSAKRRAHFAAQEKSSAGSRPASSPPAVAPEDEVSSFPALVCMALHSDGSNPDLRCVLMLDQLLGVEARQPQPGQISPTSSFVLVFRTGERVEIELGIPHDAMEGSAAGGRLGPGGGAKESKAAAAAAAMKREKMLWSLLQIHAILCTAVVERFSAAVVSLGGAGARARAVAASLPALKTRNVDLTELQYASTANGFLGESPALVALLERQRNRGREGEAGEEEKAEKDLNGQGSSTGEMDGIAYDMLMGNYNTRMALFVSKEEKKDAEDILNSTQWYDHKLEAAGKTRDKKGRKVDAAASANALSQLLQKKMRDLEAETCRRLIAWEDQKHHTTTGGKIQRDTEDALSLAALFNTLDLLEWELESMETWLEGRARVIKPLTDDCSGIEEENRQLEQQWKSYDALGQELRRLLSGLDAPSNLRQTLSNPGSALTYDSGGNVNAKKSAAGIDEIYNAGRFLKDAIDRVEKEGGVHLRAVSERLEKLAGLANQFCTAIAQIVVTVMEQISSAIVEETDFTKSSKQEQHPVIAKRIRDAQRKVQASLIGDNGNGYIKLIEVLALLKPSILPAIRDAYSELVAEGILSKKRMKVYFASLPQHSSVLGSNTTIDLQDYKPVTLRGQPDLGSSSLKTVNSQDIQKALSELLPVIAREAYFTAALFGLSSRHMDGREKKRNFESAKRSVDHSSQYFRYYMSRICGIASEEDAEGKRVEADAMLSLVSSIHLNEAMDSYIDRQKKGGDHSLSLAYVRATILDMRKKVDKQWVTWVEDQIKWTKTNANVPMAGKRAGVFASFSRFPSYLDHVMMCCKTDRAKTYSPSLHRMKVVSYYLQKMAGSLFASLHDCAERETTDQQYAANVMRMENSYYFTQCIKQRGNEMTTLFQKQVTAASAICKQSTDAYLGWMIKREFKALHSLFSNISRIRRDVGDADVPIHVPRVTFVKTLSNESNREVMKEKIGVIYARMEKHLSEEGGLLPVAWKALVKVLYEWFGRWEKLSTQCYKYVLEPSAVDVVRIAKAAGGGARHSKPSEA